MDKRKNLPFSKYPIIFRKDFKPPSPITFIEEKTVNIEGIKKDYYIANNIGQLFNRKGKEIKPRKINSGYYTYNLVSDRNSKDEPKYKHMLSHRLFKITFDPVENMEDLTVNHINMDKSKNELSNLEWLTQKENNEEKDRNFNNSGINTYNSLFTYDELKIIVQMLNGNFHYSDILKAINKPDTKNYRDYIGNIKRGITYKKEVQQIMNDEVQRLE